MKENYDVIVVGAGPAGIMTCYELYLKNPELEVLLIDKGHDVMNRHCPIKDKKIKSLQYQLEHYSKRDTLILRDTVFKDPNFVLDTCIIDRWNKSCLHLQYPGTIALSNEYENEKFITLSSHREPIKPRKWFLPRWFTKKQTVVEVLVVDENPYVKTKQQRFVEIID